MCTRAFFIQLTAHHPSANAVDCNVSALSVWLSGSSYAPAKIAVDGFGACRVIYSVLKVRSDAGV